MHGVNAAQVPHTILQVDSQHAVWIAGVGCVRHEVIGEEYHHQHLQRIAASVQGRGDVPVAGWLVPESGSVAVWTMGSKVGYLPPPTAAVWLPVVQSLAAQHNLPVACQATLDAPSTLNKGILGMVLWLPALGPAVSPAAPPPPVAPPAASTGQGSDLLRAELYKKHVAEVAALRAELESTRQALVAAIAEAKAAAAPSLELAQARDELRRLGLEVEARRGELRSVEEAIEIQSFGFYKPRYGFESSAQYTARLKGIREEQQRLESRLHKAFAARRVNLVNLRKEYFKVSLEEIQEEVKRHHGLVSFALTAEAEEYRKSLAAREAGVVPELMMTTSGSGDE